MNRFMMSLFMLLCVVSSHAQGMSDSQVMQYVQREVASGTSQSQIAVKLMQRGVTMQQLQRVRSQYERRGGGSASSAEDVPTETRLREANGSVRVDAQGNALTPSTTASAPSQGTDAHVAGLRPEVYVADDVDNSVNGKKVFGRDIFNKRMLSFEPSMNIATPSDYVVGAGDRVIIDVYGASQKSQQLEVSPDGTVVVEGFGPIHLAGLTVDAANKRLREQLGSRYSSSSVRLTVGQTRTISVSVMGEVAAPGTYTLSAFASVFHALYMAGGVSGVGTLRNIKVYRGGRQLTVVDVYDYILNGRLSGNVRLADNDVIVVGPYECIVDVAGSVKRPMAYEMRADESVATLLKYAGGFTGDAYRGTVRVNRVTGERLRNSVFNVDEFGFSGFRLMDGDSVTVGETLDRYESTVRVTGAVFRPGQYRLGDGVTTVRTLIERADGLRENAFTGRAVLQRMQEDRTRRVISVDVAGIMGGTVADIPLENEDVLLISTEQELISDRTVSIYGQVQNPGSYEYASDETIEDLILRAGGLTDAASVVRVDVSRRLVDPKATTSGSARAETFTFSLKDGFVVDGERGFTLAPFDHVSVRRSPGYQVQRDVTVEGEVLFAGNYTLSVKGQRLSDVVRAAGGVTDEAYVRGARLERVMNDDEKFRARQLMKMVTQQSGMGFDEEQMDSVEARYYVGIELDKALATPGGDDDIVLRAGDRLVIPEYNGTVRINGNVMFPNTAAFSAGKNYRWYVKNLAGGFGNDAKRSRTYILYQNGMVAKARRGSRIEPGCEIIVPTKTGPTLAEQVATYATIGTSLTSMITMVATVANLLK